ncbi:MAG TPA: PIN domain-containing protein [Nocardioides sp.]|nr:PIN domain-containing protein [Nocardioides sp.]
MPESVNKVFVDTNVLAYRMDKGEPDKRRTARARMDEAHTFIVSTQVLLELYSVLTRKFEPTLTPAQARAVLDEVVTLPVVPADADLVIRATLTAQGHQLSIWDAMIVEAAAEAGCDELWSEDLAAGAELRGVRVVNPFAS